LTKNHAILATNCRQTERALITSGMATKFPLAGASRLKATVLMAVIAFLKLTLFLPRLSAQNLPNKSLINPARRHRTGGGT
jgi:hypothetical protein